MDKSYVLQMAKDDLVREISSITLENASEKRILVNRYLDLIETLNELSDDKPQTEETTTEITIERAIPDCNMTQTLYAFERRLRGGLVPELGALINEGTVRRLELRHGDLLRIERVIEDSPSGQKKYFFALGTRPDTPSRTDRVELRYCVVEQELGELVARNTGVMADTDVHGDMPDVFSLRDKDIDEFDLEPGDIVDIAFFSNTPDYVKVIFKHHIAEMSKNVSMEHRANRHQTVIDEADDIEELPQELVGKRVLVIGCEPRKTVYKQRLESLGAEFDWTRGSVDPKSMGELPGKIEKADVVLILIDFIRHRASKDAVQKCKQGGVPFKIIEGLGVKAIVGGALDLVKSTHLAS